jgi:hypothetical protein
MHVLNDQKADEDSFVAHVDFVIESSRHFRKMQHFVEQFSRLFGVMSI